MEKKPEIIVVEKEVAAQKSNLQQLIDSFKIETEAQLSTRFEMNVFKSSNQEYYAEFDSQIDEFDRLLEIIVGYRNGDFRWTGKVIHDNIDAFFQALERELEVLDDLDNDEAIVKVLKEAMMKLERPNLIVDITGGAIQEAISSIPVSMCVLDGDLSGEERIKEHDGVLFHHYSESVRYDPNSVEHVNNQPDKRVEA